MIEHDHDRTAAYHAATVAYEADKAALQRARCDEADRRNALWQQTKGARRREYNALTAADDTLATLKAATRAAYETSVQAREECEATAAQVPIAAQTNLGPFTRLITIARARVPQSRAASGHLVG